MRLIDQLAITLRKRMHETGLNDNQFSQISRFDNKVWSRLRDGNLRLMHAGTVLEALEVLKVSAKFSYNKKSKL